MAALPYIQLYIADYLADTAHLTTIEHGAYLLLIFNYWQRGHALNNANGRLASVVRMSNEEWAQHEQTLSEFFEIDGDEWINHRIDEDLAAVEAKSTKASMAGKASGATRRANAKRKPNGRSTNAERTPNHTDTDTDTDKEQKILSSGDDGLPAEPKPKPPTIPYDDILAAYHDALPMLPAVRLLTDGRRKKIKSRWHELAERQTVEYWQKFFTYASQSDFLTGRSGKWSSCNFDWLMEPGNHLKVVEGNYENRDAQS